ncbi:MAG: FAD-binding protein, partial [Microthrixaceae bacterium]|nr:FAD-binding protein [Microthrixaceae bacterium]
MSVLWKNWAGNQRALVELSRPTTEHELCSIVARAAETGTRVKVVGAGRSFSDVGITDGLAVELFDYGRILSLDTSAGLVSVQAGA